MMRLWHKDLIPVLPRQQLLSQWRECCAVIGEIDKYGSPRSPLTKKIMNYPIGHFWKYGFTVYTEMRKRGYACQWQRFHKHFDKAYTSVLMSDMFKDWHNNRYLKQCYYNLQEKYDCDRITQEEWEIINCFCNKYFL